MSIAQEPTCACTTPVSAGTSGQLVSASGDVLSPRRFGLVPIGPNEPIGVGSQMITGPNSSAQVAFGTCLLTVGENTEVVISGSGDDICLQVSEAGVAAAAAEPSVLPAVLGIGAAAGLIGALSAGGGDEAASP